MTNTADFGISYLPASDQQPAVLQRDGLMMIQALLNGVIDRDLNNPPTSPDDGDAYIVGANPTGQWAGHPNQIAVWADFGAGGAWRFIPGQDSAGAVIPMSGRQQGMRAFVRDEEILVVWSGVAWEPLSSGTSTVSVGAVLSGGVQAIPNNAFAKFLHSGVVYQDLQNGRKFWLGTNLTFTVADSGTDTLTATAHGMVTGDGPLKLTNTGGALPTGLAVDTSYWIIRVDNDTIKLASSFANALAGTAVDITGNGTGTHTLDRASRLVIPGGSGITRVRLNGQIAFDVSSSGQRVIHIGKNIENEPGEAASAYNNNVGASLGLRMNISTPVMQCQEGDWFALTLWQNSGGNLNTIATANTFGIERVR